MGDNGDGRAIRFVLMLRSGIWAKSRLDYSECFFVISDSNGT
jgi:hypothetical protein